VASRGAVAIGLMLAALLLGVPSSAVAAPTTIAQLHGDTAIEAYGGVEVWSDYDAAARSWHVVVRRGDQISTPTIPTAKQAIEVDVGPGPSGSPMLAYTECAGGCHVVVSGVDGSDPRVVSGSEGASHPTIWGDRVAWVSGREKVMSSLLNGSGRRVLGGAPHRKCYYTGDYSARTMPRLLCAAPHGPLVEALQLYRGQLALIDTFDLNDGIGNNGTTTEVRTEAISGGLQRLVALLTVGEGNERWIGPSWSDGMLYFYEDENGTCGCSAVYRFDPARNTYARARASTYLTGFSMIDGRWAYETTAPGDPRNGGVMCGEYENTPCLVRLSAPLAFKPFSSKSLVFVP
jgi:hypothetical protein